ncbi:MAG: argininosuccinate lyase [Rickettsiales bacterium]|nr:argininosuccinate lyase [Rickettsiales bacterium]
MDHHTGQPPRKANPLWGGHYAEGPSEIMERINASIGFDQRLYRQDIAGSIAHATMLGNQGILSQEDVTAIISGLKAIEQDIAEGNFTFSTALEDIHMNIEASLKERIGDAAGRLHTARSRNDQVATDFRLWVRDATDALGEAIQSLQEALINRADEYAEAYMPGFTHLQTAQPVTLGHHLLAYVEMLGRDRGRLADTRKRLNESPLGAAALAGTSFPIDREQTARALGFDRPMANSIDAVSDRDFALEFLAAGSILAMHLSRLAEELVLWASRQFGFIRLSEAFTTGSSIMPQKRNPDAAELVRARAGRIFGALIALLTVMKGLPLTYSKDMQDDKEPVFESTEALMLCVRAMDGMIRDFSANLPALEDAAASGFATATDLADWLVQTHAIPFREAHHIVGAVVREAETQGCRLDELSLDSLQAIEPRITQAAQEVLTVRASVARRTSQGGTAPIRVREAIQHARIRFL